MDILIVMCMGILVGRLFRSGRIKKVNELLSIVFVYILTRNFMGRKKHETRGKKEK